MPVGTPENTTESGHIGGWPRRAPFEPLDSFQIIRDRAWYFAPRCSEHDDEDDWRQVAIELLHSMRCWYQDWAAAGHRDEFLPSEHEQLSHENRALRARVKFFEHYVAAVESARDFFQQRTNEVEAELSRLGNLTSPPKIEESD